MLVVSQGERPVALPDVVTQLVSDATPELAKLGLKLEVSERTPNDNIPADVIASQNPAAGTKVQPGSTVSVVVSAGPPQFPLQDFASSGALDAAQKLQSLGLNVRYTYIVDPSQTSGTILRQDPAPGASVAKGAAVTLSRRGPGRRPRRHRQGRRRRAHGACKMPDTRSAASPTRKALRKERSCAPSPPPEPRCGRARR